MNIRKLNAVIVVLLMAGTLSAQESKTIKLDRRTNSRYQKSAYSFRFKTQDESKHRNYVDLVFESGRMRINNHGGLNNRIADLGKIGGLKAADKMRRDEANWTQELLIPEMGHTYAMEVNESNNRMLLVFYVIKVTDDQLIFEWLPVTKGRWPIDIRARASAGTSGMINLPKQKKYKKYRQGQ